MNFELPTPVLYIALITLSASFLLCLYRMVIGPTTFDRALAVDVMGAVFISVIVLFSIQTNSVNYLSAILVFAALGFFALVAVAKFLFGGDIVDRNR